MAVDMRYPPELVDEYTARGYWTNVTTKDLLERNATDRPEEEALVDRRVRVRWGQVNLAAERVALKLLESGFRKGDVIAIQLPNWVEFAYAVGACGKIGAVFCQFSSEFRRREVEFILGFSEARALIIPASFKGFDYPAMISELRPTLPKLEHIFVVGDPVPPGMHSFREIVETPLERRYPRGYLGRFAPDANEVMRLAFTSGTTGDPKCVVHTQNSTLASCALQMNYHHLGRDDVSLLFLPVGLNWGLFMVLQTFLAGGTLVMMEAFSAGEALRLIQEERVTYFPTAPTGLIAMLNHPDLDRFDLKSLRLIATGGASCPLEVLRAVKERFPCRLIELYGMLEAGFQSWTLPEEDPETVCGTVGKPLAEVQSHVVDDAGREVPPGNVGEIASRGPTVMAGYFKNPEANAKSFMKDGWFLTGDLGVLDERGYLRIVGRKKDMIIRGGANIYPREIEEVLFEHPKILEVAVIGIPDPYVGEKACACIVPKPGESISFEEIAGFLRGKIATYKLPERVEVLSELPHTPTGKIQKSILRERLLKQLDLEPGSAHEGKA
ncbi:MAG: AMP-binding protein [Candidatus Rokubacteria bacterium]|nr:AMP-binding protein [Candidatus Rokubacteria bacterium]